MQKPDITLIIEDDLATDMAEKLRNLLLANSIVMQQRMAREPERRIALPKLRGKMRNRPCSCGSGVKAKWCHHEVKTVRRYEPISAPTPRAAY